MPHEWWPPSLFGRRTAPCKGRRGRGCRVRRDRSYMGKYWAWLARKCGGNSTGQVRVRCTCMFCMHYGTSSAELSASTTQEYSKQRRLCSSHHQGIAVEHTLLSVGVKRRNGRRQCAIKERERETDCLERSEGRCNKDTRGELEGKKRNTSSGPESRAFLYFLNLRPLVCSAGWKRWTAVHSIGNRKLACCIHPSSAWLGGTTCRPTCVLSHLQCPSPKSRVVRSCVRALTRGDRGEALMPTFAPSSPAPRRQRTSRTQKKESPYVCTWLI